MEQFAGYLGVQNKLKQHIHNTHTCKLAKVNYGIPRALQKTYRTITIHDHSAALHIVWELLRCLHRFNHLTFTQICTAISITFDKVKKMFWQTGNCLLCSGASKTTVPEEEIWVSLHGKLSYCNPEQQCSEANTVVPGTLASPVIRHVTAGLLSVTPHTVCFPQHVGGRRRKV